MECHNISEIEYAAFGQQVYKQLQSQRIPISVSIELTFRCNNECIHCYCNQPGDSCSQMDLEMTTDQIRSLIDQIAARGCLWLHISGGEPLLRRDFCEIHQYAKKKGFLITVSTNGTLITDEMADFFAHWKPFCVEISLYGINSQTYEGITQVPGSYNRCLDGIQRLLDRNVPLRLKTPAMKANVDELDEIKAFAQSRGILFRFDAHINSRLENSGAEEIRNFPLSQRLSCEETVELDRKHPERTKELQEVYKKFRVPTESGLLYTCGGGKSTCHIDPHGNLSACLLAREPHYDLIAGCFDEGWDDFMGKIRQIKAGDSKCRSCHLGIICGCCPGWSQLEHGDSETPVEYLCEIAHKRALKCGIT